MDMDFTELILQKEYKNVSVKFATLLWLAKFYIRDTFIGKRLPQWLSVKNLPASGGDIWVQSLGWDGNPLTPVFLPGKCQGQRGLEGSGQQVHKSWM